MIKAATAMGLLCAVVCALLAPRVAHAIPATCLPPPLTDIPQPPVFTMDLVAPSSEHGRLDVWRQACEDGSGEMAVLARVTPITPKVFVCSASLSITQGPGQIPGALSPTADGATALCDEVSAPTTFFVVPLPGLGNRYVERASFVLGYAGAALTYTQVPAPFVTVFPTGCTSCVPGNVVGFAARVTNPGPATTVELKVGVRFPDGTPFELLDETRALAAGSTTDLVLVPQFFLPPKVSPGVSMVVEAALLEPVLGLMWSRSSVRVTVH
jgi:hypothetical protein